MRKFKLGLTLLTISSALLVLSACNSITVYDRQVCADLGAVIFQGHIIGAHCDNVLTSAPVNIPLDEWNSMRVGRLSFNSQGFNDDETAIQQACAILTCNYEQRTKIDLAVARMRKLKEIGERAKLHQVKPPPAH